MTLHYQEELFLLRQEVEEQEERLQQATCPPDPVGNGEAAPLPPWLAWATFGLGGAALVLAICVFARHLYGRRYTDSVSYLPERVRNLT